MISHVVLMKPRTDLTGEERRAFAAAFEAAATSIPSVRAVRIGKRILHGAGYELTAPDTGAFFALIDFDDLAGLQIYLTHPLHQELGALFSRSLSSAFVYDFETGALDSIEALAGAAGGG